MSRMLNDFASVRAQNTSNADSEDRYKSPVTVETDKLNLTATHIAEVVQQLHIKLAPVLVVQPNEDPVKAMQKAGKEEVNAPLVTELSGVNEALSACLNSLIELTDRVVL